MTAPTVVRAACYLRISSDPNDKREGVARQREDTAVLCDAKGWQVVDYYEDNNRSASNGKNRPEWDRLLADIAAGKIDAVAAWDQDRQWRKMSELEDLRAFFYGLPKEILLATTGQGDLDIYSPTGVLTMQIKTAVSEHEIAIMKARQRRAARAKAENGIPQWKSAFGYVSTPDGPVPDPVTAPLVKRAYSMLLTGASLGDIARTFNDANALGLKGQPWRHTTVSMFLRAPRNAGLRCHGKRSNIVGKGNWLPLVDEHTWREVQALLSEPSRRPGKKSVQRHRLTGAVQCGKCGHHLSGHITVKGINCYQCKKCRGVSVRTENLEPMVMDLVAGRLAMADAADLLKSAEHDAAEAARVRAELHPLHARLESIGVDYALGNLTGPQAKAATELVNQRIAELEAQQHDSDRLRLLGDLPLGQPEIIDAVKGLSDDRFRAIMAALVTVTVAPVGKGGKVFNPDRIQADWKA